MLYIKVNSSNRVSVACEDPIYANDLKIMVDKPDTWDWEHSLDWVLVDGALVYDPLPAEDADALPTIEERLAALESAQIETMLMALGGGS